MERGLLLKMIPGLSESRKFQLLVGKVSGMSPLHRLIYLPPGVYFFFGSINFIKNLLSVLNGSKTLR